VSLPSTSAERQPAAISEGRAPGNSVVRVGGGEPEHVRRLIVDTENAALVALVRGSSRPPAAYTKMIEAAGSAVPILEQEHGLLAADLVEAARTDLARWQSHGIRALTLLDPEYPANLRAADDRPPLIFVTGGYRPRDRKSVAVIGARRASPAGLAFARAVAGQLVDHGFTVFSGLAAGIDTAAHIAALARGGRTVAVIGTGVLRCYPAANLALQQRIATECAVISQFMPEAGATRSSFPMRNAVMSGLTQATVVIEASLKSGARTQARFALAQRRPVLLARRVLAEQWARELAERPGVHVVESAAEVTAVIGRHGPADQLVA
jgi:DNA processing protein